MKKDHLKSLQVIMNAYHKFITLIIVMYLVMPLAAIGQTWQQRSWKHIYHCNKTNFVQYIQNFSWEVGQKQSWTDINQEYADNISMPDSLYAIFYVEKKNVIRKNYSASTSGGLRKKTIYIYSCTSNGEEERFFIISTQQTLKIERMYALVLRPVFDKDCRHMKRPNGQIVSPVGQHYTKVCVFWNNILLTDVPLVANYYYFDETNVHEANP